MKKNNFLLDPYHISTVYLYAYQVLLFILIGLFDHGLLVYLILPILLWLIVCIFWIKNPDMPMGPRWLIKISSIVGAVFFSYVTAMLLNEMAIK